MEYIAITGHKRELQFFETGASGQVQADRRRGERIPDKNSSAAVNQRRGQAVCKASAEYLSVFR